MSRLISDILDAQEPHFTHQLLELERLSGHPGHDNRLISDIAHTRKNAIKDLGLDHEDTTPKELFYALRHRAIETSALLENEMKINPSDSPDVLIKKVVDFVSNMPVNRDVWAIKQSVIKQMLKKQPPKKLLKMLGLRSIDSVLKRNSPYELLALAYEVESNDWITKIHNQFKKLSPTDFQSRESCIYVADQARVDRLHKGGYKRSKVIVPNFETATILIVTPQRRFMLDALALTLGLLQTLYDLRIYGAYFRHISVNADFSSLMYKSMQEGLPGKRTRSQIGWRALQRHFNINPESFDQFEQPHLQYEDIQVTHPVTTLANLYPQLKFWDQVQFVFMPSNESHVSMHLSDVVTATSNQVNYGHKWHSHVRNHVWEELGSRYLLHEPIKARVIEIVDKA